MFNRGQRPSNKMGPFLSQETSDWLLFLITIINKRF
jgi:hypothetical protein